MSRPQKFLSTPSARRATNDGTGQGGLNHISIHALREEGGATRAPTSAPSCNFYPRPPRGGRRWQALPSAWTWKISIHALREEGDGRQRGGCVPRNDFYPRPPRGGRLVRRCSRPAKPSNFYPRPPRGGRLTLTAGSLTTSDFYPRPPRGGRLKAAGQIAKLMQFLSTPSARRATEEVLHWAV